MFSGGPMGPYKSALAPVSWYQEIYLLLGCWGFTWRATDSSKVYARTQTISVFEGGICFWCSWEETVVLQFAKSPVPPAINYQNQARNVTGSLLIMWWWSCVMVTLQYRSLSTIYGWCCALEDSITHSRRSENPDAANERNLKMSLSDDDISNTKIILIFNWSSHYSIRLRDAISTHTHTHLHDHTMYIPVRDITPTLAYI